MAFYRGLDPTTGRWMQVDPKAEHDISTSPYVAHYNSPINFSDPLGDCPFCPALSQTVAALSAVNLSTILPAVTITASAATSASVLSSASVAARGAVAVATLPTLTQSFVLPQYDQWIESGYTTAPYQRYTFFESEPGNSGRTLHVEYTLRSDGLGGRYIENTFYRWYDSFELLEKLGGPTGVVEMIPNLMPVKAAGSSISKSLTIVAAKVAAKGVGKFKFPGTNPAKAPKGFEWKGKPGSTPGSKDGNWYNPKTGESLRPDLNHPDPIGPHWDYKDPTGKWWRIFQDGSNVPK